MVPEVTGLLEAINVKVRLRLFSNVIVN